MQMSRRCLVALFHALREQTPPAQEQRTRRPLLLLLLFCRRPMSKSAAAAAAGGSDSGSPRQTAPSEAEVHMDFQKQSFESALDFLSRAPNEGSAACAPVPLCPCLEVRTSSAQACRRRAGPGRGSAGSAE